MAKEHTERAKQIDLDNWSILQAAPEALAAFDQFTAAQISKA